MKAMVLSAGFGRRMLPLTFSVPKPILPVLGRPMTVQLLHRLSRCGIREVTINLHHHPQALRDLLGDGRQFGLSELHFSYETELLGTAGGVRGAADHLRGKGPILVINGDSLSDIDYKELLAAHLAAAYPVTLALAPARPEYSRVDVDRERRVVALAGRPDVEPTRVADSFLFTGCQIIDESVLDRIPADGPSDLVRDVYRGLAADGQLGAWIHDGFWWEFGSPEQYLEGSLRLLGLDPESRAGVAVHDAVRPIGSAFVAVGAGARIASDSVLRGNVALGFACRIGEASVIEDSVVMPEAWVGPEVRLERSIVGPGVELPAGFRAERALVCRSPENRVDLPPSTKKVDRLLVRNFDLDAHPA